MPNTYSYAGDLTVETLNKERRLLRSIYLAQKPGTNGPAHRLAINGSLQLAPDSQRWRVFGFDQVNLRRLSRRTMHQ